VGFILYNSRPSTTDCLINTWPDTDPADKTDIDALEAYLFSDSNDINFNNHVELSINIFTAYACMIKGQRLNQIDMYNAGRKYLYSTLFFGCWDTISMRELYVEI
jgi:hypothetical protein